MVPVAPDLGETKTEEEGEGDRRKGVGDGVLQHEVELVGDSLRSERQRSGPFLG